MSIHPADQPVTDPFWAAVRRRHPDVDLVLLPPEPSARDADPADDAAGTDALRTDLETVRHHAVELGLTGAEERVELGSTTGTARATAREVRRGQEAAGLEALAATAAEQGWALERRPGAIELLLGRLRETTLRASFATTTGVLVAEVSGGDRRVGTDRARELVGGGR